MPAATYSIVLCDERTGRVVRRVDKLSQAAADRIVDVVDRGAEIGGAVGELVGAAQTIRRVLEPLTSGRARKLPSRGRR